MLYDFCQRQGERKVSATYLVVGRKGAGESGAMEVRLSCLVLVAPSDKGAHHHPPLYCSEMAGCCRWPGARVVAVGKCASTCCRVFIHRAISCKLETALYLRHSDCRVVTSYCSRGRTVCDRQTFPLPHPPLSFFFSSFFFLPRPGEVSVGGGPGKHPQGARNRHFRPRLQRAGGAVLSTGRRFLPGEKILPIVEVVQVCTLRQGGGRVCGSLVYLPTGLFFIAEVPPPLLQVLI